MKKRSCTWAELTLAVRAVMIGLALVLTPIIALIGAQEHRQRESPVAARKRLCGKHGPEMM